MTENMNTVAVIGLGYIGLPTAVVLATHGADVIGVDVNPKTVEAVNTGIVPFVEPGLEEQLVKAVELGRLTATTETPIAKNYIVAVPTPFKNDRSADLKYIEAAAAGIASQLVGDELVILESTSPPGTTEHMANFILGLRPDLSLDGSDGRPAIHVAHCPERVLPGKVMLELVTNDRIVGGITQEASERAKDLYETFCEGEILVSDAPTAEMAKLVENSFRDVNIAFANELSVISDRLGIDVWELIRLANRHPRVNILQPGPGVGGHCIAVDPWFIVDAAPEEAKLIRTAREVNDSKPEWVRAQVIDAIQDLPDSAEIAIFGLAFKANIDDLRESPAVDIAHSIALELPSRRVNIVEPNIFELPKKLDLLKNTFLCHIDDAIDRSDVIAVLVDHDEVRAIPSETFDGKIMVDTKGVLSL